MIIPVMKEVAVVEKKLMLVEEVRITRRPGANAGNSAGNPAQGKGRKWFGKRTATDTAPQTD